MALHNDDKTLYVANLHKNVTDEVLYELFVQAGPIERVSIPKSNNQNFIYGFVTYVHDCSIDYAIQLYKGTSLFQKRLQIKRKGERRADPASPPRRCPDKDMDDEETNQPSPTEVEQCFSRYIHQSNDPSNPGKTNFQLPKLMEMPYKGRYKPYDRDNRRQTSARPASFNNRNRRRNHSSSHYDKSHRERKGRYWK